MAVAEIASGILDVEQWATFRGWGPLPGIKIAEFEVRTEEVGRTRTGQRTSRRLPCGTHPGLLS